MPSQKVNFLKISTLSLVGVALLSSVPKSLGQFTQPNSIISAMILFASSVLMCTGIKVHSGWSHAPATFIDFPAPSAKNDTLSNLGTKHI